MNTYVIDIPENVEEKTVKAVLKALGVAMRKAANGLAEKKEKAERVYNLEFVAKIKQGEKDLAEGKGIRMTLDEIWK